VDDRFWPIPGFPGLLRKLTMAGRARASKVSLLARLRTYAPGHKLKYDLYRRTSLQD